MSDRTIIRYKTVMPASRPRRHLPADRPTRVQVLVLRDCTPIVSVGVVDLLRKASDLAAAMQGGRGRQPLDVTLVSATDRRLVHAAGGIELRCHSTVADAG